MALNNTDGRELQRLVPSGTVVNAGSWALRLDESRELYAAMQDRCRPKVVVIPVYYGDFSHPAGKPVPSKEIRWDWVDAYLRGGGAPLSARMQTDLSYVLDTWRKLKSVEYRSNAYYTSLDFDETGAVLLDDRFHIDPKRWNGFRSTSAELVDDAEYSRFADLLRAVSANGARFLVVRTPMTSQATATFDTPYVRRHWRRVEAVTKNAKGIFVDLSGMRLADERFADFCHLKGPGPRLATRRLVSESGLLADNEAGAQLVARGKSAQ
jgi:hypothetical protein